MRKIGRQSTGVPFWFNAHDGEVGHSVVIGATKDDMTACYESLAASDVAQYDAPRLTRAEVAAIRPLGGAVTSGKRLEQPMALTKKQTLKAARLFGLGMAHMLTQATLKPTMRLA
jgi:hypothetical protein